MHIDFDPPVAAAAVDSIESYRMEPNPEVPPEHVFPQSVASGDPTSKGVILWTRIAPDTYAEDIPLTVEIADDKHFTKNHQEGVIKPEKLSSDDDYTIKVDLDESDIELEADTHHYYQFEYNGVESQIGRCKTLPDSEASPESIRFVVTTCQDYQNGYFGAAHYIAEEDVDFLVDLGDFIYEVTDGRYALHSDTYPDHDSDPFPSDEGRETGIAHELDDYRHLYRTYHSDRFLQESLERHTRIHLWDDHEFANDIYWDYELRSPRAPGHPADGDPERMRRLVRDALKAYWEYTPTRAEYDPDAEDIKDVFTTYRSFQFGDLVTLIATDERLFRTQPQPKRTRTRLREWLTNRFSTWAPLAPRSDQSDQTMLGTEQRAWFIDEVHDTHATWTVWANEVLTLPLPIRLPFYNHEAWDGFEAERKHLMREVKASQMMTSRRSEERRGVRNFITLTGDMHSYLVGYQRTAYPENTRVGVELMTPSITSINIAEAIVKVLGQTEGRNSNITEFLAANVLDSAISMLIPKIVPNVEVFGSHEWGYSVVTFTPEHCIFRVYSVDKTKNTDDTTRKLLTEIRVPDDQIDIQEVS